MTKKEQILQLYKQGKTIKEIAKIMKCKYQMVYNYVKKETKKTENVERN
ncbi:MAG: helix-turn-helix domain-containing protein [Candidatus Micrarchaeia archaeon]